MLLRGVGREVSDAASRSVEQNNLRQPLRTICTTNAYDRYSFLPQTPMPNTSNKAE